MKLESMNERYGARRRRLCLSPVDWAPFPLPARTTTTTLPSPRAQPALAPRPQPRRGVRRTRPPSMFARRALRLALCLVGLAAAASAKPPPTRDVYTYFTRGAGYEKEMEAIGLWNASWTRAGWRPTVLTLADAKTHPRFKDFLAAFFDLPTNNRVEYEVACYMRWVAMSTRPAGGVMTDYDILNVGWRAPQPVPARLSTLESHVPAVVIGTAREFQRAAEFFETFKVPTKPAERERFTSKRGVVHLSDMALVNYGIDQGLFDKQHLAFGYREVRGEEAPLVHFSHSAVHLRGGGKGRNALMRAALRDVEGGTWKNV